MSIRWGLWALVVGGLAGCMDREWASVAAGRLTVVPTGIDFENVAVFDGRQAMVTLSNVGSARILVEELRIEGASDEYSATFTHDGPHSLPPSGECELKVRFTPLMTGSMVATLVIRSDANREPFLRVPLRGAGVEAWARVSPHRLDFGRIKVGAAKTLSITVQNPSEGAPVEVSVRVVGPQRDEFSIYPERLEPQETRTLPLTFSPSLPGRKKVALAVTPCRGCADVPVQVEAEAFEGATEAALPEQDLRGASTKEPSR